MSGAYTALLGNTACSDSFEAVRIAKRADSILGVRFYTEDEFDEFDLWDACDTTTSSGEPRPIVEAIHPKGLAAQAGMQVGDVVVAISGRSDITRDMAMQMLRGVTGVLTFILRRSGLPRDMITEPEFTVPPVVVASNSEPLDTVPKLRLPSGQDQRRVLPLTPAAVPQSIALGATPEMTTPLLSRDTERADLAPSTLQNCSREAASLLRATNSRLSASGSAPMTPRAVKSSMQLLRELREVGETIISTARKVDQALQINTGTRGELARCSDSTRKQLLHNPSLGGSFVGIPSSLGGEGDGSPGSPGSPSSSPSHSVLQLRSSAPSTSASRARERRDATVVADKKLRRILRRVPELQELEEEVTQQLFMQRQDRRRRKEVNRPMIEALTELQETSAAGVDLLGSYGDTLKSCQLQLKEMHDELAAHHAMREEVVNLAATSRTSIGRIDDALTHEVLRAAAELEDVARMQSNKALKAARLEQTTMQANKAEVQRAAHRRMQQIEEFRRRDAAGTSFKGWSREDLKRGGGAG